MLVHRKAAWHGRAGIGSESRFPSKHVETFLIELGMVIPCALYPNGPGGSAVAYPGTACGWYGWRSLRPDNLIKYDRMITASLGR